jgi:flagellin
MSLTINTNIASLNAQRNLSSSQASLATSLQRLSSGLRINSAKDDAAGLAIANRFTTQINGLNQAVVNANDAISESQTAESALSTLTDNLQRIRQLAVEAANGTNSSSDRAALDAEVQQRSAEITRIASQTTFNGLRVLDGTAGPSTFQVGANVGDTITVNYSQGVRADQIGQVATSTGTAVTAVALGGANTLTLQVGSGAAVNIGASAVGAAAGQTVGSAYSKVQAINAAGVSGLTASASTTAAETTAFSNVVAGTGATNGASTYNLKINGIDIFAGAGNVAAGTTLTAGNVATQVNLYSSQTGVTAAVNGGKLTFTAADGRDITFNQTVTAGTGGSGTGIDTTISGGVVGTATTTHGLITLSASSNITVGGAGATDIGFTAGTIALNAQTLANANVLTVANANAAIAAVDSALTTVSSFQSQLGAIQNRFTSTVSNLQAISQNLTASRSTIQDADFAAETANLTKAQVLQQAGISVLAQANAAPQSILKLLQ